MCCHVRFGTFPKSRERAPCQAVDLLNHRQRHGHNQAIDWLTFKLAAHGHLAALNLLLV